MKLQSVKMRGWIGLKKGLGIDELSLDLSGINGLVALSGPNGKGKTTLMEGGLQPYRMLASRKKALQHHVYLRDSSRELIFTLNNDEIRTLIKIDSDTGKSEGFVWVNGQPKIDGKATSYDRFIEDLLGSPDLYFASVFAAQNGQKLSDMTPGQLKGLFSEFLRLDRLIAAETTSKQAANILEGQAAAVAREIEILRRKTATRQDLNLNFTQERVRRTAVRTGIENHHTRISLLETSIAEDQALQVKNAAYKERLVAFEKEKADLEQEMQAEKETANKELGALRKTAQDLKDEIGKYSSILERKAEIEHAISRLAEHRKEQERLQGVADKLREESKVLTAEQTAADKAVGKLGVDIRDLEKDWELNELESKLKRAREDAKLLDLKDPECKSATCSFIVEALKSLDQIPTLQKAIEIRQGKVNTLLDEHRKAHTEMSDKFRDLEIKLIKIDRDHRATTDLMGTIQREIRKLEPVAAQAADLKVAESRIEQLEKDKAAVVEKGVELKTYYDQREISKQQRWGALAEQIAGVEGMIDREVESRISKSQDALRSVKAEIEQKEKSLKEIENKIAAIEADLKEIDQAEAQIREYEGRRIWIQSEASEWRYLQGAFSANGLRALEIDSVAPAISGYANDLLSRAFGATFSVRFRTQDDTGREVLDILVIRDDGDEVLLDNLSGGEKVWNLKALRLAMTLVSKQKSGMDFRTCLADEEDGALDVENAVNFVHLYKAFMGAGGFDDCYFISHKPDCVAMADHQILFNGRGVEIQ
ncbi:MAG: hypothetical protein M0R74_17235 [Dehalococcoidia bacterium]|nr:hypothetical protein [Dehalococcoidia bacterium]